MSLTINTNGNGVQIIPPEGAPVNFNNARYRWYFYNNILFLSAGGCMFMAVIGEVTVDGNTPANEADLNTALGAVFPADGSGATPGIDDVLAEAQVLTADRVINYTGKRLKLLSASGNIELSDVPGEEFINIDTAAFPFIFKGGYFKPTLSEFIDNAAALSGGVPGGGLYYTDVAGERVVKQAHD